MLLRKAHLIFWCIAVALLAYLVLDFWARRNAPLHRKLERLWQEDVTLLEESGKLPQPWFDVKEVEIFGGTPETKSILKRIHIPVAPKNLNGAYKLETLVIVWEEEGIRGATIQYNLVDIKTQNMIKEIGRTLTLRKPRNKDPFKALLEDLRQ